MVTTALRMLYNNNVYYKKNKTLNIKPKTTTLKINHQNTKDLQNTRTLFCSVLLPSEYRSATDR